MALTKAEIAEALFDQLGLFPGVDIKEAGIVPGSTLFYDLEAFNTAQSTACTTSALWFMSSWTTELHRYLARRVGPAADDLVGDTFVAALRVLHQRVVLTSGTFDILHEGHSMYLEAARGFGLFGGATTVSTSLSMALIGVGPGRDEVIWTESGRESAAFRAAAPTGDALTRWRYQRYIADYARVVSALDDEVGRVLDFLDETGMAENTLVVYASDQGFFLGDHGWFDKRWMYEESLRTPMLARWPGVVTPGSVNRDFVMNLDLAQTFLEIGGVTAPATMQGASIAPLLVYAILGLLTDGLVRVIEAYALRWRPEVIG